MDSRLVDGVGLWCEHLTSKVSEGCPALFCDRDGVIVEEVDYLGHPKDVKLIPAAAIAIRMANRLGIRVVIATNQSGIGRGYYGWDDFSQVQDRILSELARFEAEVDLVLACAYHGDAKGELGQAGHQWRKPNPGMMFEAERILGANLSCSLIVGDKLGDLQAGHAAGIKAGLLVRTGHGQEESKRLPSACLDPMRVELAQDALGALPWLDRQISRHRHR